MNKMTTNAMPSVPHTMSALRGIHVETERDHEIRAQLQRLLQVDTDGNLTPIPVRFTASRETRGIVLVEPAGGGKTTAIAEVLRNIHVLGNNPDTGAPHVVQASVESPATQKSLGIAILRELGIPHVSDRIKIWELFNMVRQRFLATGTTVLWIDEAHDLFLTKSAREVEDMLKTIKSLMQGEAAVIVILSGTERLGEITSIDPQVSRRFTKIMPNDLVIGGSNDDLDALIRDYCRRAGLSFTPHGNVVSRLIHGSRGRFGRAVETTINAIEQALLEGDQELERQHFAEAWGMQEGCAWDRNVFVAEDWRGIELDVQAEQFDAARTARQRQRLSRG
jgi:hypothetical protein